MGCYYTSYVAYRTERKLKVVIGDNEISLPSLFYAYRISDRSLIALNGCVSVKIKQ